MATLQKRKSRGHNYWSIVESRRVNGKPRPIILEYLGPADTLLKRLQEGIPKKVRSYSHGLVAVMLDIAEELKIVQSINRHINSKQVRDGFTVGGSLLLAAIGRTCKPTSKSAWYEGWAKHTSLAYLLRMSLNKLDSQHFWDQMEAFPVAAIPRIEEDILKILLEKQKITLDILLYDTSNFFTYIASNAGVVYNVCATPVFCDIDPQTFNLDPNYLRHILSTNTMNPTNSMNPKFRAVIPVHLYGQMADMDEIIAIAEEFDLAVIEDAAQAIGAKYLPRAIPGDEPFSRGSSACTHEPYEPNEPHEPAR